MLAVYEREFHHKEAWVSPRAVAGTSTKTPRLQRVKKVSILIQ